MMHPALRSLSLLLLAAPLSCAGEPFATEPAPDDVPQQAALDPLTAAPDEPGLVLLHACSDPGDGCALAARHPVRAALRCADGRARPSCPVASVRWPGEAPDELRARAASPLRAERLAARGRWGDGGALEVLEVLERGGDGALPARLLWARADGEPGASVAVSPLAGGWSWRERWLDVTGAPGDDRWRNDALVQARTPRGLLLAGRRLGQGASQRLVIDDAFVPRSLAPTLCGQPLRHALAAASDGLLWPSESDRPIEPLLRPPPAAPPAALDPATLRAWLDLPDGPVEPRALRPLAELGREGPDQDDDERALAARFRALRAVLEGQLGQVQTFAVGEVDVRVLVVGVSRCGELAGVDTSAVES